MVESEAFLRVCVCGNVNAFLDIFNGCQLFCMRDVVTSKQTTNGLKSKLKDLTWPSSLFSALFCFQLFAFFETD